MLMEVRETRKLLCTEALTPRELEVLGLVADGMSNREIARLLNVKKPTVGSHLRNIYQKLYCRTRAHAAVTALRLGIIN